MTNSQKSQPADAFHPCCGRRTQLNHARNCPTLAPAPTDELTAQAVYVVTRDGMSASVPAARRVSVKRRGKRISYSRGHGDRFTSGAFSLDTVDRAKEVAAMLKLSDSRAHAHLDAFEEMFAEGQP